MRNTIKLNREFRKCYSRGKTCVSGCVVLYAVKNNKNNDSNRFGLTVSKAVGCAVKRNRAKRLLREAYKNTLEFQVKGFDIIIVARARINGKKADAVQKDFVEALKKLSLWNDEKSIT